VTLKFCLVTIRKIAFVVIIFLSSLVAFSQQKIKPNKYYTSINQAQKLDSIFPINDIQSITVTNYSGSHTLTKTELVFLKDQLKQAKFAGGLLVKPGHVSLTIKLKDNSTSKAGFVYAYEGSINFDGGINRLGERFSGTYYLPLSINFDNYK